MLHDAKMKGPAASRCAATIPPPLPSRAGRSGIIHYAPNGCCLQDATSTTGMTESQAGPFAARLVQSCRRGVCNRSPAGSRLPRLGRALPTPGTTGGPNGVSWILPADLYRAVGVVAVGELHEFDGQGDAEGGAFADFAFHVDAALHFLHDLLGRRQAQSGAPLSF